MDRKTLALILTEVVLIVALVVVVAKDFNAKPHAEGVADTQIVKEATETAKDVAETVKEAAVSTEKTAEAVAKKTEHAVKGMVAKAGEAVKEAVSDDEKAEVKEEEKTTEKTHAQKETAVKPAEKAAAPAKAAAAGAHDVIAMNNAAYPKHTKGIVQFTHKKHYTEYKATCGDCHHDENAEPLKDLKEGDPVQGCIECHPKPGKAPAKKGQKLTDAEKMEYHAEALHANCIDCHKDHNKKNNTKAAPTSCGTCHPKDKK